MRRSSAALCILQFWDFFHGVAINANSAESMLPPVRDGAGTVAPRLADRQMLGVVLVDLFAPAQTTPAAVFGIRDSAS